MADSIEPWKMLWADHCCHGNEIWARRGDPVVYRLVSITVDRNNDDVTVFIVSWLSITQPFVRCRLLSAA